MYGELGLPLRNTTMRALLVIASILIPILILGQCCHGNASRMTSMRSPGRFGHLLYLKPKRGIPVSGPSRKHNDLGVQAWTIP
ncbi:hypothetical protein M569_04198 [Genlisea aurea]|uniref:Uncharacterized protein n=1 Tax=Genlisea aurea TaxID=192259 RepID=S8EDE6_9LAMI|nr:hypothetical protein M569_04198 [Genlisea aurea]